MAWSKVKKGKYPIGWWYHKLLCEFSYAIGKTNWYYYHLHRMLYKYNFNLYGDEFINAIHNGFGRQKETRIKRV